MRTFIATTLGFECMDPKTAMQMLPQVQARLQRDGHVVMITQGRERTPQTTELVGAVVSDELVDFVEEVLRHADEWGDSMERGRAIAAMVVNEYFHIPEDALDAPATLDLDGEDQSMVGAILSALDVDVQVKAERTTVDGVPVLLLHASPLRPLPRLSRRELDQAQRALDQHLDAFDRALENR